MGQTITEKILARVSGRESVKAGEEVFARPDFVLLYDFPGYTDVYFRSLDEDFGLAQVVAPERLVVFIDHLISDPSETEESLHRSTREWCSARGVEVIEREGIGHQLSIERGIATPGAFVVHFDGHVSQLGALGALGVGLRRNVLEALVREHVSMVVPASVRVEFTGRLSAGVMARDVLNTMVQRLGPLSCRQQVLELAGPGVAGLGIDELQTITGLAMFLGALTAIVEPDQARLDYARPRARLALEPVIGDPDAQYDAVHHIDLGDIEPVIVAPPSPANIRPLSAFLGLPVTNGYIGSCAGGRLEDLRAAADVLRSRQIAPGFTLNVVPSSAEIARRSEQEGLLAVLSAAGANILPTSCDHCYGRIGGMPASGRSVSTGTLNVRGRMGSIDSEIYLCSAAVIAATALEGRIADPRALIGGAV